MTIPPSVFEQVMATALRSYNAGRFSEAETACSQLLAHAPRHPAVHQLLAVLALAANDVSAARTHIIQSLAERPQHGPSLLVAGKIVRTEGDLATAAQYFECASAVMPGSDEPDLLLGMTLVELGSPTAISVLRRLLDSHERHADAWCLLGLALRRHGEPGAALEAFRNAIDCNPSLSKAHFYLATEMYAQGRAEEAIAAFTRAQELDSGSMEIALNLGTALHAAGDSKAARTAFEKAVALAPSFAEAWFNLGLACQDLRDLQGAAAAFRTALHHRPDYAEAAVNLGIVLQDARLMNDAMDAYRMAVRLRPETFGRIAQALAGGSTGQLWLSVDHLRRTLAA